MKLGTLQVFNVKKKATIVAKAEGKKKNLPQKKEIKEAKEEIQPRFIDVVKDKRIDVTDTTYLVISASQVDGEDDTYVDVRMYRKTDKYEGPTKKGVRIHVEFLEELIESLVLLNEELEEVGI